MKHLKEYQSYNEDSEMHGAPELENYMFFQNLHVMKRDIEAILALDQSKVDHILHDGHGWALDHIATASDDLQEVSNFLQTCCSSMDNKPQEIAMVTNVEDFIGPDSDDEEETEENESMCSECGGPMIEGWCASCH